MLTYQETPTPFNLVRSLLDRLTPTAPVGGGTGRDLGYNEVIIDVEAWRPLPESCETR